jgi:iron complex transport system permease protein
VIALSIEWPYSTLGTLMTPILAFLAAILTVGLVFKLGNLGGFKSTTGLILAGVAVNALASALTSTWLLLGKRDIRNSLSWMLGGMVSSGWDPIKIALPLVAIGLTGQFLLSHQLNVLQFGDEQAANLGVQVRKVRLLIIFFSTLTTATVIAFAGIIGFIGLVVPHIIRILVGGDHRQLLPLSMLGGAFFLLFADILARVVLAPQELPVGIITAMTGAPFFLWLLNRTRKEKFS